ncbi:hypothetical protein RhiirB3_424953 [Rhizophagus irregularis]|nr:hypothetical protein RhiirB3_424953 [Rhizophagus irregularis]
MIFYQLKIIGEKALKIECKSKNITIERKFVSNIASNLWKSEPASVKNTYKEIENGTFNVPVSNSIFSISDTPTSNKQQISEDIVSKLRRLYYQGNVASLGRVYEAHSKAVKKEHCIKHKWDCSGIEHRPRLYVILWNECCKRCKSTVYEDDEHIQEISIKHIIRKLRKLQYSRTNVQMAIISN